MQSIEKLILCVCVSFHVFLKHQKYNLNEILALGVIWANMTKPDFLRGGRGSYGTV